MKLNEEQMASISVLVNNEVKYRETYSEVYDHILTALEARTTLPDLQKAYSEILEEDFGGHPGLEKLESFRERAFKRSISSRRLNFFVRAIKWPGILVTLPLAVFVYYNAAHHLLILPILFAIVSAVMLPMLTLTAGNFIMGWQNYRGIKSKASIRDDGINAMADHIFTLIVRIMAFTFITGGLVTFLGFKVVPFPPGSAPIIYTATFMFCVLNAAAFFSIYYQELKKPAIL
ncbi:hypothetical protein ACFGVR_11775 [Mucilaginibacter sp. AW1-3]